MEEKTKVIIIAIIILIMVTYIGVESSPIKLIGDVELIIILLIIVVIGAYFYYDENKQKEILKNENE